MRLASSLILATLARGPLPAQTPAGNPAVSAQREAVFRARTEQVVVPVTVKDSGGRFVEGLEAKDFRVLEDGVEQKLAGFSSDPAPLAVALLIDAGLSRPTAARLRATFSTLSEAFGEFDEVGVFAFDTGFRAVAGFTADHDAIYQALKQMELGAEYSQAGEPLSTTAPRINGWPVGGPAPTRAPPAAGPHVYKNIDDAVDAAARALIGRDPSRRKVILIISDGLNSTRNQVSAADLLARLRKSGLVVYSIGLDDAKLSRGWSALARYGPATGGELYTALKKTAIEPLYARISEQARYQYVLAYVSLKPPTVAPVFRTIEVRVKRPGVTVIARDGYIPEPRAPQP